MKKKKKKKKFSLLPKLDGDWANIDGLLLFNPPEPIKIDDGGGTTPIATCWCDGLINNPLAVELVGTILTYGAKGGVYVLNDDFYVEWSKINLSVCWYKID